MGRLNDPIPFSQSKIYNRDFSFKSYLYIFSRIGHYQGGIDPEGLIREGFHLFDDIFHLVGRIGNRVQHANPPSIRNGGYKFW